MKSKIFLILTIIILIISCSNKSTKPNNGMKEKEELGNVETPGNNTGEKPILPPLEDYSALYSGVAKYYTKTLDDVTTTKPTDENIYVEIYDDSIVVYSGAAFFFDDIKKSGNKYESTAYYDGTTYKLNLQINDDNTATLTLNIRDSLYSYYFEADKLAKSK